MANEYTITVDMFRVFFDSISGQIKMDRSFRLAIKGAFFRVKLEELALEVCTVGAKIPYENRALSVFITEIARTMNLSAENIETIRAVFPGAWRATLERTRCAIRAQRFDTCDRANRKSHCQYMMQLARGLLAPRDEPDYIEDYMRDFYEEIGEASTSIQVPVQPRGTSLVRIVDAAAQICALHRVVVLREKHIAAAIEALYRGPFGSTFPRYAVHRALGCATAGSEESPIVPVEQSKEMRERMRAIVTRSMASMRVSMSSAVYTCALMSAGEEIDEPMAPLLERIVMGAITIGHVPGRWQRISARDIVLAARIIDPRINLTILPTHPAREDAAAAGLIKQICDRHPSHVVLARDARELLAALTTIIRQTSLVNSQRGVPLVPEMWIAAI